MKKIPTGWLVAGFVWCIFMGIMVVSIGLGSVFPGLDGIAGPFVCPGGKMAISSQQYTVSPVESGYTITWYCLNEKTGAKTELGFWPQHLVAGSFYGLLIFVVGCIIWYVSSRRGQTPHEETAQSKARSQLIQVFVVIAAIVGGTLCSFGASFIIGSGPLAMGVVQITEPAPTDFVTPTPQGLTLSFGGTGSDPGLFEDVRAVSVDPNTGTIFTGDYSDGRVEAFNPNGKFLTQWPSAGIPVMGLGVDGQGNVFVAADGKIQRFDSSGKLTATLAVPDTFLQHVAVGPDGNLVAGGIRATGNTMEDLVLRLTPDGKVLDTIHADFTDNGGLPDIGVLVAVDPAGDIYAQGESYAVVLKFSPQDKLIKRFGSLGEGSGQLGVPSCIVVDRQNKVYIGDSKGIEVLDSNGNLLSLQQIDATVRCIALDGQGNMYVTTNYNQVLKMSVPKPKNSNRRIPALLFHLEGTTANHWLAVVP